MLAICITTYDKFTTEHRNHTVKSVGPEGGTKPREEGAYTCFLPRLPPLHAYPVCEMMERHSYSYIVNIGYGIKVPMYTSTAKSCSGKATRSAAIQPKDIASISSYAHQLPTQLHPTLNFHHPSRDNLTFILSFHLNTCIDSTGLPAPE